MMPLRGISGRRWDVQLESDRGGSVSGLTRSEMRLMAFGILFGVLVGLAAAAYFARQRRNSWSASNTDGGAKSRVTLIAGPSAGRNVTVDRLPTNGSSLTSWTWGLVGHDVHRGVVRPRRRVRRHCATVLPHRV
jgi:hypothetical protein